MKKNIANLYPVFRRYKKTLSIMRNVLLIVLVTTFQTFAVETYSQTAKLNLELKNTSLKDVLAKIEEQSNYYFLYNGELIDVDRKIDLSIQNKDVETVLDEIFDDSNVSVLVKERHIILTPVNKVSQQEVSISGVVTDGSGVPLPGVTVVVKGTAIGTITDFDGKYNITNVPGDGTLVFSFVGMKSSEVLVNGQSSINVTLEEETIGLEEVVAIGYGVVKKKDLTGAVSSVKTEELKQNPVTNVAQALQGKLSGVSVTSQDGRPGADVNIRIRGGGSITQSNDPLIVVDGVPGGSLNDIPADQIESIDVLKDASSTAIYGSRGANGVILVTTKGLNTKVGNTKISYSGYVQSKEAAKTNDVLSAQDYILHQWSYMTAMGGNAPDAMASYYGLGAEYGNHYADYASVPVHNYTNDLLRSAMTQVHNVSVSSATDKTTIAFNANMVDDEGIKIKSGYKRYNASLKLEHELYDDVKIGFNISYVQSETEGRESITNGRGTLLSSAYLFSPIDSEYIKGHGDLTQAPGFGNGDVNLDSTYDPYKRTMDIENVNLYNRFSGIGYINWDIIQGLTFRTELAANRKHGEDQYYDAGVAFADDNNRIQDREARLTTQRGYGYRSATTLNWEVQNMGADHRMSVLGGFELSKSQSTSTRIYGKGYPANFDFKTAMAKIQFARLSSYDAENDLYPIAKSNFDFYNSVGVASTTTSAFGRFNYSYKGRYLFTATMRADGSSKFAPNHRWGYFPAGAFAWRVIEEPFLEGTRNWLDNLKLRLSIGSAGADNIPYDAWNALYDVNFSDNGVITYDPKGVLPNPDLKWETTISRNIGIDYSVFNRVYGSLEVYWNNTKDLLGEVPVNPTTGFTTQFQNIGKTSNKGIEFSLAADIIRKKDFNLSVNATYNYNKNNIEELAEGIITDYGTDWNSNSTYPRKEFLFKEGTPVGTVIGYEYDGFYSTDDFNYDAASGQYTLKDGVPAYDGFNQTGNYPNPFSVVNSSGDNISAQIFPGALKIKDTDGDGSITPDDATELGEIVPRHTGGFGLSAYYKGIDFSANFTYALGGHVYNIAKLLNTTGRKDDGFGSNRYAFISDAYKIYDVNTSGDLVAITDPDALDALNANAQYHLPYHEFGLTLSEWFEKSDYLRLNTLTVGYSLPKMTTKSVGIEKLRVYFTGGNLLTITGYSGLDPEVNTRETSSAYPTPGLDFGAYPRSRTYTFGLSVDF
ncbi:TonB-dependent receptor [uncultured Sunxiuqinia sp.]|uniref:TonB-dependent receptor n=1 Tax=uncultured Sunxiuqinia sp. TaxID=1573825 RepID=UPI002AA6C0EA|nr:TonB-dependent receptor [uncultured Sunxiuqinia sp.]